MSEEPHRVSLLGSMKRSTLQIQSHHRIIDTQMTGYEKATLTLATFKTSDVGECAAEVWADKAEHKRRPLNRPYLTQIRLLVFTVLKGCCTQSQTQYGGNAISVSQATTAIDTH